jgi:hypothetical protein
MVSPSYICRSLGELIRSQVETETLPGGTTRDREEIHDRGVTQGQISPRHFRGLHSLPVRFREGFHPRTRTYGEELWESLGRNIDLILSHPNGWEGREQEFLRKSVVQASVFTEEEALSHVYFVTEGEATFNFCVANTRSGDLLEVFVFTFIPECTF